MRVMLCSAAVMALVAGVAGAQTNAPAKQSGGAFSDSLRSQWKTVATYYLKSADEMPEENYGFKPVDSVRTFGQIIAHVAGVNYVICSAAKGEKAPYGESSFEKSATTRDAIIKAAKDSVVYCDGAFNAATDKSLTTMVIDPFNAKEKLPLGAALVENISHVNEHYGNLVTYLRIKGLVPPSSQPSR